MHWPEKAQGGFIVSKFTINLQRIKSRSSEAMRRCWGKLRKAWSQLKLSQVRKSFTCQDHFLHLPHTAALEVNSHSAQWVRQKHFDYGSADVIHQRRGDAHCIRGRDIWLRPIHPPALWGTWHFQDRENKLPLERNYALSVGKKRRANRRRSITCSPLAGSPQPGKFLFFQKR